MKKITKPALKSLSDDIELSNREQEFLTKLKFLKIPEPVKQYRIPGKRRFLYDFAYPEYKITVEIQGGTWMRHKSGHTSGVGVRRDCEKHNYAILNGWTPLAFTSDMISDISFEQPLRDLIAIRKKELLGK